MDWTSKSSMRKTEMQYKETMPSLSIIPPLCFGNSPSNISVLEKLHTRVNMPSKLSCVQSASSKPTVCPQTTPSLSLCKFIPGDDEDTEQQLVVKVFFSSVQQQH